LAPWRHHHDRHAAGRRHGDEARAAIPEAGRRRDTRHRGTGRAAAEGRGLQEVGAASLAISISTRMRTSLNTAATVATRELSRDDYLYAPLAPRRSGRLALDPRAPGAWGGGRKAPR